MIDGRAVLISSLIVICGAVYVNAATMHERQQSSPSEQTMPVHKREKRQFFGNNFNDFSNFGGNGFGRRGRPNFNRGNGLSPFNNFNSPRRQQPQPGNELVFSNNPPSNQSPTTAPPPNNNGDIVFINNQPIVATMAPFTSQTTPSPRFLNCFGSCQTTSEYNPICASNMQQYHNEQKFECARRCGADIQIVRRGACQGLFPMMRG